MEKAMNNTSTPKLSKARKGHRCDNCLAPIRKGAMYQRDTQLAYGRGLGAIKRCQECAE